MEETPAEILYVGMLPSLSQYVVSSVFQMCSFSCTLGIKGIVKKIVSSSVGYSKKDIVKKGSVNKSPQWIAWCSLFTQYIYGGPLNH